MPLPISSKTVGDSGERLEQTLARRGVDPATTEKYLREWQIVETEAFNGTAWPIPKDVKALMKAYIQSLSKKGLAPQTIRRRLQVANRFYEAQGKPRTLKGVRAPAAPGLPALQTLTDLQCQAILKRLEHINAHDAFELVLLTGMRLSEAVQVRYSIHDLRAQRLTFARGKTTRIVALGRSARNLLQRRLFSHAKWHRKLQWYTDAFHKAANDAGVHHAKPLMFRNTFAAKALANGLPLAFVMNNLGVRSKAMSKALIAAYLEYEP